MMPRTTTASPLANAAHDTQGRLTARVVFALGRDGIEPDLTSGIVRGDAGLLTELTNAGQYALSRQLTENPRLLNIDGEARRLVVGCEVRGKGWSSALELAVEQVLRDTLAFQAHLPASVGASARLDQEKVSILCSLGLNEVWSNKCVDELSDMSYYVGIRTWSKTVGVVEEATKRGKLADCSGTEVWVPDPTELANWNHLTTNLLASLSADPRELLAQLIFLQTPVREVVIRTLQPAVRHLLQENPPPTTAEKKALAKQLNQVLSTLGLAVRHPETGQACSVAGIGGSRAGYFVLQTRRATRPTSGDRDHTAPARQRQVVLNDQVPPLELIEGPRQERFADHSVPGRK